MGLSKLFMRYPAFKPFIIKSIEQPALIVQHEVVSLMDAVAYGENSDSGILIDQLSLIRRVHTSDIVEHAYDAIINPASPDKTIWEKLSDVFALVPYMSADEDMFIFYKTKDNIYQFVMNSFEVPIAEDLIPYITPMLHINSEASERTPEVLFDLANLVRDLELKTSIETSVSVNKLLSKCELLLSKIHNSGAQKGAIYDVVRSIGICLDELSSPKASSAIYSRNMLDDLLVREKNVLYDKGGGAMEDGVEGMAGQKQPAE